MATERPVLPLVAPAAISIAVGSASIRSHRLPCLISGGTTVAIFMMSWLAIGCSNQTKPDDLPEPMWVPAGTIIAVSPALNFSGNTAFDPVILADLMASELATLPGVGVIGVNRTMAILAEHGIGRIQSPRHALQVCDRLGADAILVFAVTEYDPYTPVVGITAQLYSRRTLGAGRLDDRNVPATASAPASREDLRPVGECQQVFNASHERVRNAVKDYADKRSGGQSPYGWQQYLVSQDRYLRFCCHAIARDLLKQQVYEFGVAQSDVP